tara:strand:+ start:918 stop:1289 length:372 start_codon:yes stop_codon:yes gene_type:complete
MEGACVYNDSCYNPVLVMYKEFEKNKVLYFIFTSQNSYHQIIQTKVLTQILPKNCIHILSKLPYFDDLIITLNTWVSIAKGRLNLLNKQDYNKEINILLDKIDFPSKNDLDIKFQDKFKKNNN